MHRRSGGVAVVVAVGACDLGIDNPDVVETEVPTITYFVGDPPRVEMIGAPKGYAGPYQAFEVTATGERRALGTIDPKDPFAAFPPAEAEALREAANDPALLEAAMRMKDLSTREAIARLQEQIQTDPALKEVRNTLRVREGN